MVLLLDEIRLTRDAMRYGFAVGKVRVLEARSFDRSAFERLLDAPDFDEQKRLLSDTPYGRYMEGVETASDVERALDRALEDFYALLESAALPDPVIRFFRLRYDFTNLKAAAKARLLSVSVEGLLVDHGTVPRALFESGELTSLPEPLGSTAGVLPTEPLSEDDIGGSMAIDTMVDQEMFSALLAAAREARSKFLIELAELSIDAANVKTLVRGRRAGLPAADVSALMIDGGSVPVASIGPLAALDPEAVPAVIEKFGPLRALAGQKLHVPATLDVALDLVNRTALRRGRMSQAGADPVISYVLARESEVSTLRMLLLGRIAGLDNETLRRHVRSGD